MGHVHDWEPRTEQLMKLLLEPCLTELAVGRCRETWGNQVSSWLLVIMVGPAKKQHRVWEQSTWQRPEG